MTFPETSGQSPGETAVVVLGHGSRADGAGESLARTAGRLARELGCRVLPASLQFNRPTLAESCGRLADRGYGKVVIVPFFLFNGNHIRQDIPREVESLRERHPGVEFVLSEPLGEDGRLVELLADRVRENVERRPAAGGDEAPHPIEAESFAIIDGLLSPDDAANPVYQVVRRVIHTTGDPELGGRLEFSPGAVDAGVRALSTGAAIVCDVNMAAAGIQPSARRRGVQVLCGIAAAETERLARQAGITRSAAALRRLAADGAVIAIGNAPTALMECLELYRRGRLKPSLVIGVPVGFVGAADSKAALAESGLPYITLPGDRGGSGIAAAVANALLRMDVTS